MQKKSFTLDDRAVFMALLSEAGRYGLGRAALSLLDDQSDRVIDWRRACSDTEKLIAPCRHTVKAAEAPGISVEMVELDEDAYPGFAALVGQ